MLVSNFQIVLAGDALRVPHPFADHVRREETVEVVHAITSLPRKIADAATLLPFWRGRWRVETLHYFRDVHFGEDHCRVRNPTGGHALACFRNVALNLLRRNQANGVIDALRQFTFRPASLLKFLRILKQ